MCNLYSNTANQAAIRALAKVMHDRTGNLPPLPGILPDYPAPIVREGTSPSGANPGCSAARIVVGSAQR